MNLAAVEIKAFVPAHNFEESKQFYVALGFEIGWSSDGLAYVCYGHTSFLLQAYNHPEFTKHYMMHLQVESADDWHAHVMASNVVSRFNMKVSEPEDRPWAMRDFTMTDPSGVLWRVGQNIPRTL